MTTRYASLWDPGVDALFDNFGSEVFRLETRQSYNEGSEAEALGRFVGGELPRDFSGMDDWCGEVTAGIAVGKSYRRVRVVTEPLSAYVRFELAWAYRCSTAVGEDVRLLAVGADEEWPTEIPRTDFWLFDNARLLNLGYDDVGTFVYAELVEDSEVVRHAARASEVALGLAVPYDEYTTGLDEMMRPRR